jgi:hypothetical protein
VSLRERVLIALGVLGAIALVVYPLAYRLSTEQGAASTAATLAIATSPLTPAPVTTIAPSPSPSPSQPAPIINFELPIESLWVANAMGHRGLDGSSFDYDCSPNGPLGQIWGSDIYTDDSSVCTAGVHRGAITRESGGTVTVIIRPALASYEGTRRNGVTSEGYGPWEGSYEVVVP